MVTPRPHTELEGVGLCVHPLKDHRPYAPVQVGDVVLSFPFRPMGAEGGPNKVLLSSRPSYHHGPHHFCPAGEALCPQVCRRGPPSPLPLFWFLAAFALGPQGSCLQSSHSICPCGHWQPGPGLMELGDWFCFPLAASGAESAVAHRAQPGVGCVQACECSHSQTRWQGLGLVGTPNLEPPLLPHILLYSWG